MPYPGALVRVVGVSLPGAYLWRRGAESPLNWAAAQAFERLYFLERAAQAQVLALSTGRTLRRIPDNVVVATAAQIKVGSHVDGKERQQLHFDALKRMLDRQDPDYVR